MDVKQLKVYSTLLRNWRKGNPSDVFDLMYESSLDYTAVKSVLDSFIICGDVRALDNKTYELIGDVENRAAEIFAGGHSGFGQLKTLRGRLVNTLHRVAELKADDEEYEKTNSEVQRIIAEAERRQNMRAAQRNGMQDTAAEMLVCDEDYDDDDEDLDDDKDYDDDRNNGELCAEEARPFYEIIKEDVSEDLDSVIDNVFGVVAICNHCYIAPEHLMLALLCTECNALNVLTCAGVDGDKYYEKFRETVPKGDIVTGFTPRARFMLRRAVSYAKDIGGVDAKADSKHLLLAVLTQTNSVALRILKDIGADVELISDELDKVLKKQGD